MNADAVAALRERFERLVAEYELRATQREASPSWEFAAEDIRAVLAAAPLPSDTPADGLDAAWREAEAALPEGWRGPVVRRSRDFPDQYWALAEQEHGDRFREGYAATPTMALRALAFALAALTQEPRSTREEADPA